MNMEDHVSGKTKISGKDFYLAASLVPSRWRDIIGCLVHHVEDGVANIVGIRDKNGSPRLIEVAWISNNHQDTLTTSALKEGWVDWVLLDDDNARCISKAAETARNFERHYGDYESAINVLRRPYAKIEFPIKALQGEDYRLIRLWCKAVDWGAQRNSISSEVRLLDKAIGSYDAARLVSARQAEITSAEYYKSLRLDVKDVSITQILQSDKSWTTHDLLVSGRPIDVKNSRRSFSSHNSYTEHCVPEFKSARASRVDVSITGVLSDYKNVAALERGDYGVAHMLGEVSEADINRLESWVMEDYGTNIQVNLSGGHFIPGWIFEYPNEHYRSRVSAIKNLKSSLGELLKIGYDVRDVPRYLLPLIEEESIVEACIEGVEDVAIWKGLRRLDEAVGYSRRSLFMYIINWFISSIKSGSLMPSADKLKQWLFPIVDGKSDLKMPLELHDELCYVGNIIEIFKSMWTLSNGRLPQWVMFRMIDPNILQARLSNSRWMTILAYCGGWIDTGKGKVKCGRNPIYYGQCVICEVCGKLICHACGFCSNGCKG